MMVLYSLLLLFGSYAHCMEQNKSFTIQETRQVILKDPVSFIQEIRNHQKKMMGEIKTKNLDTVNNWPASIEIIKKYQAIMPLVQLGECPGISGRDCPLDRMLFPELRDAYEKEVSKELAAQLQTQKEVHLASFGSGDLSQDLIVYTKALAKVTDNPKLTIHNIDLVYKFNTPYSDLIGKKRLIEHEDFTENFAIEFISKSLQTKSKQPLSKETARNIILSGLHYTSLKNNSMLDFLKNAFPKAAISLYVHQSADSYLQYMKREKLSPPTIVTACDIDNVEDFKSGSTIAYADISKKAFENPNAATFLLAREDPSSTQAQLLVMKKKNDQTPIALISLFS
ncbi:hypothetical protein HYX58_05135 [Candidatus Dependentiae bacterium]|nr:hypothetical protein [Candidatus Dependentiae bacterium]